jgi:hypothetical protein
MTIKTQGGKVLTKEGKVSCECCGYCKYFDIEVLLYQANFSGGVPDSEIFLSFDDVDLVMSAVGINSEFQDKSDQPAPGWKRERACWRFLCREVSVSDGQITSEKNTYIGGPTTTGKDLWVDICLPLFGPETESGTYIYSVDFYGWAKSRSRTPPSPRQFQPSDTGYEVIKWKVTKQE